MGWIKSNWEVLFSGSGIFIISSISAIIWWAISKRKPKNAIQTKQELKAGDKSSNMQAGRDINVYGVEKELQNIDKSSKGTTSNRITKSYGKEFEILPELWKKLQNALGKIASLTSRSQTYPDFYKMNSEQLKSYLEKSELQDFQKKELLNSSDKVKYYIDAIFWYDLKTSQEYSNEFHNYLLRHKIFVQPDLFNKLQELDTILRESLAIKEIATESLDRKMGDDAYKQIRDDAQPLRDLIGELIQKRLNIIEND